MPGKNMTFMPRKSRDEMKRRECPVCGLPPLKAHDPFCSRRCADVDLGRWFTGTYAIPSSPDWDDDEDLPPDADIDHVDDQFSNG